MTIADVINAVDPIERIKTCPLGIEAHGIQLCPLHRRIDDAMALIERTFQEITIADLIREGSQAAPGCDFLTRPSNENQTMTISAKSGNKEA